MRFVALNENIAAFVPGGVNREADARTALNKLMTVNSWRLLIEFLKNEGCNDLFAKREAEPLVDRANRDIDGERDRFSHEDYCFDELKGSLKARIDKDDDIDYLDDLTRADLLAQGDVYEIYIPELLSYASDISSLLTLAAVALGTQPPDDLVTDFSFEQVECDFDEKFMPSVDDMVDKLFGKHGPVAIMVLNMRYWPETDYGPYMNDAPVTYELFNSVLEDYKREREAGVMACSAYFGPDHNGEDQDYDLFFYDTSRYSREEAIRMLCAMVVVHTAGDTTLTPPYEEDMPFHHKYADEPELDGYPQFSLDGGFKHPKTDIGFKRWQLAVQEVVEAAIYGGRVCLCPICGTPIITKSDKSRVEFCCESHKTVASKRRRQRAHQLYQMGVSMEDAIAEIGETYSISVEKWYDEAARYIHPC